MKTLLLMAFLQVLHIRSLKSHNPESNKEMARTRERNEERRRISAMWDKVACRIETYPPDTDVELRRTRHWTLLADFTEQGCIAAPLCSVEDGSEEEIHTLWYDDAGGQTLHDGLVDILARHLQRSGAHSDRRTDRRTLQHATQMARSMKS